MPSAVPGSAHVPFPLMVFVLRLTVYLACRCCRQRPFCAVAFHQGDVVLTCCLGIYVISNWFHVLRHMFILFFFFGLAGWLLTNTLLHTDLPYSLRSGWDRHRITLFGNVKA